MNPGADLVLKKRRLQQKSAELRAEFADHAVALAPWLRAGDVLREGAHWLRRHPELVVAAGAIVVVARPRALVKWGRRGIAVWQTWTRVRGWLEHHVSSQ